jgi:hypothetical protein
LRVDKGLAVVVAALSCCCWRWRVWQ